jgi:DNA-binding PadR family transcriptional regulator
MIKFLLLGLLASGPRHGYELKGLFEQLFGGTWPLNPGQVYMTLERLEEAGLVTSKRVEQELLPDRRVYEITQEGRQELKRWTAEPSVGPIRLREELFAKVLTALLSDAGDPAELIWAQRRTHMQSLAELRVRRTDASMHPATKLVLQGAILRTEADLRWLDQCEEYLKEGEEK